MASQNSNTYGYGNWPAVETLSHLPAKKTQQYQKMLDFLDNLERLNQAVPGRVGALGVAPISEQRWHQIFLLYQPPQGARPCKDWVSLQSKMSRAKKNMLDLIEENQQAEEEEEENFEDTEDELETNEIRIGFETNQRFL